MLFGRRRLPTLLLVLTLVFFLAVYWNPIDHLGWTLGLGRGARSSTHSSALPDDPDFIWRTLPVQHPVPTVRAFPPGRPKTFPKVQKTSWTETADERKVRLERRTAVKTALVRCWGSYRDKAFGADEVTPISGQSRDTFGGWGATLVDSLDTLWIADMLDDFEEAVTEATKINFASTTADEINVFETTIRYLGGFLAAYDLSGDARMLKKAKEVGDLLYKAFDTPNRMPVTRWKLHAAAQGIAQEAHSNSLLAEIGSLSMEFTRLSMVTGDMKYFDATQRVMDLFHDQQDEGELPGMWPIVVDAKTGSFSGHGGFSLNAMADSMYEYLPKMHILVGGLLPMYEDMYKKAMATALKYTIFRPMVPDEDDILVSGFVNTQKGADGLIAELEPQGQHLACFTGGMLALGGKLYNLKDHSDAGRKLVEGCIWAYLTMPAGIMPESFYSVPCESLTSCPWNETTWREQFLQRSDAEPGSDDPHLADDLAAQKGVPKGYASIPDPRYHLRPEAIESVFILYRATGRKDLLDTAWKMWQAIDAHTKTELANSALSDVTAQPPAKSDVMESFWLGETLKYFYLIFSEPSLISLDEYVFNTEAHPFKRYLP